MYGRKMLQLHLTSYVASCSYFVIFSCCTLPILPVPEDFMAVPKHCSTKLHLFTQKSGSNHWVRGTWIRDIPEISQITVVNAQVVNESPAVSLISSWCRNNCSPIQQATTFLEISGWKIPLFLDFKINFSSKNIPFVSISWIFITCYIVIFIKYIESIHTWQSMTLKSSLF